MKQYSIVISDDTQRLIDRHTELTLEKAIAGSQSMRDYEDCRSYAVEALHAIFLDNKHCFDFWPRITDELNKQKNSHRYRREISTMSNTTLSITVSNKPCIELKFAECYTALNVNEHEHAVYVVTKSDEKSGGDPTLYGQQIIAALTGYAELQAEILKKEEELAVTDKLLNARNEVLALIPECAAHGSQCVPHAKEWIENMKSCEVDAKRYRWLRDNSVEYDGCPHVAAQRDRFKHPEIIFGKDADLVIDEFMNAQPTGEKQVQPEPTKEQRIATLQKELKQIENHCYSYKLVADGSYEQCIWELGHGDKKKELAALLSLQTEGEQS